MYFAAAVPSCNSLVGVVSSPLAGEQTGVCVCVGGCSGYGGLRLLGLVVAQTQAQPQSLCSSGAARGGGRKERVAVRESWE